MTRWHALTSAPRWSLAWALRQDRAGFYGYDWLERLFGAGIHTADEIRPEWQTRQPGDRVYAFVLVPAERLTT